MLKRMLLFSLPILGVIALLGFSLRGDGELENAVLEAMPEFELTENIFGRPFEAAETYAVEYVHGAEVSSTVEQLVTLFLASQNENGLPEVDLLFRTGWGTSRQFWLLEFGGCQRHECSTDSSAYVIEASNETEWLRYSGGSNLSVRVFEAEDGLSWATVSARVNSSGRVVSYRVSTHRYAENRIEAFFAQFVDGFSRPIVHETIFERNLALRRFAPDTAD